MKRRNFICSEKNAATVLALLLALASSVLAVNRPHTKAAYALPSNAPKTLHVGSLDLKRCSNAPAYCGDLPRPLDPAGEVPGTISIHFEFYPRLKTHQPTLGTLVASEGGPGFATTESRDSYLGLYGPLLDQRDLLLMDNRGTGQSHPIDCPSLQREEYPLPPEIQTCGAQLGSSAYLYGSGLAADDLAAILDALAIGKIDLYGDSYGTFSTEAFAGRHPDRLRSLVLDGAFPVVGISPWYPEMAPAFRHAFNAVCERSETCRNLPGDSLSRIERLLAALRKSPQHGTATDGDGHMREVTADGTTLAYLMATAAYGPLIFRELDAAARAYLEPANGHPDTAPLLRLLAEDWIASASGGPDVRTPSYSAGLFMAVSCTDYPQLYDMAAAPSIRSQQLEHAILTEQEQHPDVYAPFTIAEFRAMPLDTSTLDLCLSWPIPLPKQTAGQPVPQGAEFTKAPVLVLSGELDSVTAPKQGTLALALFPNAKQFLVTNSFHVTALNDADNCALPIVRHFLETLDPGDTSCTHNIPEVRTLPKFATGVSQLDPAIPAHGTSTSRTDLQMAAAATFTAGDAIARYFVNTSGAGVGLRGGTFQGQSIGPLGNVERFNLNHLRWTNDLAASGTVDWDFITGKITARLSVEDSHGVKGHLDIVWFDRQPQAAAKISGKIAGYKITASMPAP
jgi:pimeloyl-ACP methyl ester carboxylesterase